MSDLHTKSCLVGVEARDNVIQASLREELVGPAPSGLRISSANGIRLPQVDSLYRNYIDADSGEEIIKPVQ